MSARPRRRRRYREVQCSHIISNWILQDLMDPKGTLWLIAPSVRNSSCTHPRYANTGSLLNNIGLGEAIQAILVLGLALGIIGANLILIFVINNRRYASYIHPQVRQTGSFESLLDSSPDRYCLIDGHVIECPIHNAI